MCEIASLNIWKGSGSFSPKVAGSPWYFLGPVPAIHNPRASLSLRSGLLAVATRRGASSLGLGADRLL